MSLKDYLARVADAQREADANQRGNGYLVWRAGVFEGRAAALRTQAAADAGENGNAWWTSRRADLTQATADAIRGHAKAALEAK